MMSRLPTASLSRLAALCLVLAGLSACATSEPKDPGFRCPRAGMMQASDRLPVFQDMVNPSRETVTVKAQLLGLTYGCQPVPRRGALETHLTLSFTAERTPLAGDLKGLTLPYFIAIVDANGVIVDRQRHKVRLSFDNSNPKLPPNVTMADADHKFDVPAPSAMAGGDYRVVTGFELIPAQLRYNRGDTELKAAPPVATAKPAPAPAKKAPRKKQGK